jgi:hypothetical protein
MGKDLEKHITGTLVLEDKLQPGHRVPTQKENTRHAPWRRTDRRRPAANRGRPANAWSGISDSIRATQGQADNQTRLPRTHGGPALRAHSKDGRTNSAVPPNLA